MKNNYATFYLVRHGETEWNVKGLIQGHLDSSLTQKGEEQVKVTMNKLKNVKFDAIFSSDSLRAQKTAEIVRLDRKLIIQTTKALREQHYGSLEGKETKTLFDIFEQWKKKYQDEEQMNLKVVEDAESDNEAIGRLMLFLRETAVANPGKTILISTHGTVMHILLVKLGYGTFKTIQKVDNAATIKLRCDGIDFFLDQVDGVVTTK